MKRILFAAVFASLLTISCQKTEVLNHVSGKPMAFTTGMSKLTKAVGDAESTGQRNLETQEFSVWAYADVVGSNFDNSLSVAEDYIYDGIKNILVDCETPSKDAVKDDPATDADETQAAVDAEWGTTREYYWPGENKKLMFYAVSADQAWLKPASPAICPVDIDINNNVMTIKDFVVSRSTANDENQSAPNEDLMVADFVKQDQSHNNGTVELKFRHTLTKVQFLFKTITVPGVNVYVQSLKVDDLETTGTLTVNPGTVTNATTSISFDWGDLPKTGSTTLKPFIDDWETDVPSTDTSFPSKIEGETPTPEDKKAMKLIATGGADDPAQIFTTWLMIPQSVAGKKVEITYLINERRFTSVFALDTQLKDSKWDDNQYIRYMVTLAPNIITFVPEVDSWDQYDADKTNGEDADGNNKYDDIEMQN